MSKKNRSLDQWLRPLGASLLALLCLCGILLSFFAREIREDNKSNVQSLLHIAAKLESWLYDGRTTRFHTKNKKSPDLVILEITDASLNKIGRWPWTRSIHAKILDRLATYGAKVVMFDIAFPEKESPTADKTFSDSIKHFSAARKNNAVILGYGISSNSERSLEIPTILLESSLNGKAGSTPIQGPNLVDKFNFLAPSLLESGANLGFISADPDSDGYFRYYRLAFEQNASFFPSLALAGFSNFFANGGDRHIALEAENGSSDFNLKISSAAGEKSIELNPRSELKIGQ